MKSPIPWMGGKHYMTENILQFFPTHKQYCEPFFGGGSLFFAKIPCGHETINDLDEGVATFFRVLRDNGDEFIERAKLTEYGEELFYDCGNTWEDEEEDLIKAWKWWVVASMSFGGNCGSSFGYARQRSNRNIAQQVSSFHGRIKILPGIIQRLRNTQILHGDAIRAIEACDTPDCLHYVDPPYVASTRKGGKYAHEMDDAQHQELIDCLMNVDGYVILSGYKNELYEQLGWQRHDFDAVCRVCGTTKKTSLLSKGSMKKQKRTESIWLSPKTVEAQIQKKLF